MATRTTTSFGGAPSFYNVSVSESRATGERTQTETRGRFGGSQSFTTRQLESRQQLAAQQAAEVARQAEQNRLAQALDESQQKFLSAQKKEEFEKVLKSISRKEVEAASVQGIGLSPVDRLRLRQQAELGARKNELEQKQKFLENQGEVLGRLRTIGVLQQGFVAKYNADIKEFEKETQGYNSQVNLFNLQQQGKKAGGQKEVSQIPRTPREFAASGIPQEIEARKPKPVSKPLIEPPMGLPEIRQRIIESGKSTAEFGRVSFERAGLPFLASGGQIVGGGIGLGLGAIEAVPAAGFDIALFQLEKRQGKPAELRLRKGSIEEAGVKFFAGIPFVGEITGAKQAITPLGGVKITRPVIREAATTAFLFGAPEIARLGGAGIKTVSKASKAENFFIRKPKAAIVEEVSAKVVGGKLIPQRTTILLGKITEKDIFLGLPKKMQPSLVFQTRVALKEVKGIVGRQPPEPITVFERPFKLERGKVVLQEPMPFSIGEPSKREAFFARLKLGERGSIGIGKTRTLQVESPKTGFRIDSYDPLESLLEKARIVKPSFKRGFKIPAEAQLENVLERGLGSTQAKKVLDILSLNLSTLKFSEKNLVLPKARFGGFSLSRIAEREAEGTRTVARTAMREASALKSMEKMVGLQRTVQRQRTESRTIFKERERFKQKQKLKPFLFSLPVLKPLKSESFFGTGFEVFVKRRGRFEKVSKEILTEKSATGLGQLITSQTAARSFFISPVGGKAKRIEAYERLNLGSQFRKPFGKTKLPQKAFVEKSTYAINRPVELLEITRKGQAARKAKAGLFSKKKIRWF